MLGSQFCSSQYNCSATTLQTFYVQRMNSNGCVQAWIDIKCVEKSLKPFMNTESDKYMREAVRPLLELEKEKDVLLVQVG